MARIVVVDYHKGNLSSVERGLIAAGGDAFISDSVADIAAADAVVLPGVGSFEDAIDYMNGSGQSQAVREAAAAGKPFLGICLGLQLLFDRGDELSATKQHAEGDCWVDGLGIVGGECRRLQHPTLKIPHVGWDQIDISHEGHACPLLKDVSEGANFYFTHSYAAFASDPSVVMAKTHYAQSFAAVVQQGNVFATQFHPEKSSGQGLIILGNFVQMAEGRLQW